MQNIRLHSTRIFSMSGGQPQPGTSIGQSSNRHPSPSHRVPSPSPSVERPTTGAHCNRVKDKEVSRVQGFELVFRHPSGGKQQPGTSMGQSSDYNLIPEHRVPSPSPSGEPNSTLFLPSSSCHRHQQRAWSPMPESQVASRGDRQPTCGQHHGGGRMCSGVVGPPDTSPLADAEVSRNLGEGEQKSTTCTPLEDNSSQAPPWAS